MRLNSPNKFFDALASGKMVITNFSGWIRDLVEENECGIYLKPENPEEFESLIKPFLVEAQLRKQQDNARKLAERSFNKDEQIKNLMNFLTT